MRRFLKWLKKYFIPHGENDFKPHFLRHEAMMISLLVVIIIELAFLVQIFVVFDKTNFLAAVLPGVLTTMTNEERAKNDAPPLVQNDLLTKAAQLKAEDMVVNGYFAHTSPDGKTPWYWFNQVGYRYSSAGENLAVNFFESSDVAQAWMNSPSHRENIIKKNYMEVGIGIANGMYQGRNTVFVAQLFGTPIKEVFAPPIATIIPIQTPLENTPVTTLPETKPVITPPPPIAVAPIATQVLGEEETVLAPAENSLAPQSQIKSFIQKVLTSPREYVTYIFIGIILLIIFALLLILFIRSERAHPIIIARGIGLVAIILFLLFVNIKMLHLDTKVPAEGLSASVVAY